MSDIVGYLKDEGHSDDEIADLLTPMEIDLDAEGLQPGTAASHEYASLPGDSPEDALRAILTVAQTERQPPGPQETLKTGVANNMPKGKKAKAVRVDTEKTYKWWRKKQVKADPVEKLADRAERELLGLLDERDLIDDELLGLSLDARQLTNDELLGAQPCVLCGRDGSGVICGECRQPGSRALAVLGYFERGSAAGDDTSFNAVLGAALHAEQSFYVRPQEERELLGSWGLQSEVVGDIMALTAPVPVLGIEQIPLSYRGHVDQEDVDRHVTSWKAGPNLYSSIRITGWDGEPRILTATVPYAKAMGVIVGFAERAGVAPALFLGMADNLAKHLGASALVPRLNAASADILRDAHGRETPHVVAVAPSWVE